jgi:hypothetical protein
VFCSGLGSVSVKVSEKKRRECSAARLAPVE